MQRNIKQSKNQNVDMLFFEKEAYLQNKSFVVGIDEAGRGPLAGPVVAAAVLLPKDFNLDVDDSKKLSEKKREELYHQLTSSPDIIYGIGVVSANEIDKMNILKATHYAMRLACEKIPHAEFALIDGLPIKGLHIEHKAIVKGDGLSKSIAAASIIAKVWRDKYMLECHRKWPIYGFDTHKGYGTKLHIEAIKINNPCPEHRLTFSPIKEILQPPPIQLELF